MKNINLAIKKILNSTRDFSRKKISIKLVIALFLILLMPYIIRYLSPKITNSGHSIVQTFLFTIDSKFQDELSLNNISEGLRQEFENQEIVLSKNSIISTAKEGKQWLIKDNDNTKNYNVRKERGKLNIYIQTYEGLGIKDLVRRVKQELYEAEEEMRKNHEIPLFELKDFDLEISFMVQAQSTQKGKVEYHFVAVDNEIQTGSERIQKIKLHMIAAQPMELKKEVGELPITTPNEKVIIFDRPPKKKEGGKQ
ncbi:MAG: trypco2 family protein [Candidatus Hodarchaeota archaeon]